MVMDLLNWISAQKSIIALDCKPTQVVQLKSHGVLNNIGNTYLRLISIIHKARKGLGWNTIQKGSIDCNRKGWMQDEESSAPAQGLLSAVLVAALFLSVVCPLTVCCPFAVMCLSLCRRRLCFRSAVVCCTFVPCAVRFSVNFGITTDTNGKSTCVSIERPIRRNYRGFAQTYSIKSCDPWMMYSPMFKFALCHT